MQDKYLDLYSLHTTQSEGIVTLQYKNKLKVFFIHYSLLTNHFNQFNMSYLNKSRRKKFLYFEGGT
jgi:hypothetical protein